MTLYHIHQYCGFVVAQALLFILKQGVYDFK